MMMDVRDCIEPAINHTGMKKNAVAKKAGLTQQQLCDITAKRRRLDCNELVSLCKAIGITPNELLGFGVIEGEKGA